MAQEEEAAASPAEGSDNPRRGHHRQRSSVSVKTRKRSADQPADSQTIKGDPPDNVLSSAVAAENQEPASTPAGGQEDAAPTSQDDAAPDVTQSATSENAATRDNAEAHPRDSSAATVTEAKEDVRPAHAKQSSEGANPNPSPELALPALPEKDSVYARTPSTPSDMFSSPVPERGESASTSPARGFASANNSSSPQAAGGSRPAQWAARRESMRASLLADLGSQKRGLPASSSSPSAASYGSPGRRPGSTLSEAEAATASPTGSKTLPLRRGKRMSIGYISSAGSSPALGMGAGRLAPSLGTPGSVISETSGGHAGDLSASSEASYFSLLGSGRQLPGGALARDGRSPSISSTSSAASQAVRLHRGSISSIASAHSTGASTPTYDTSLPLSAHVSLHGAAPGSRLSIFDSPARRASGPLAGAGAASFGLGGTGPREEVETAMMRSKDLLSRIAAKEQRCLELKEELKREEDELKALRDAWQKSVSTAIAAEGTVDGPLQKAGASPAIGADDDRAADDESSGPGNTSLLSESSELAAMQAAAAETIKGWSGKITNFFEVALAPPTPDARFGSADGSAPPLQPGPPQVPAKDAPARAGLESLSEAAEDDEDAAAGERRPAAAPAPPAKEGGKPPPAARSAAAAKQNGAAHSKRTSVFGSFGFSVPGLGQAAASGADAGGSAAGGKAGGGAATSGSSAPAANGGGGWGAWSQRLKEAREGASTLLAKAEKGLESMVTLDEQGGASSSASVSSGANGHANGSAAGAGARARPRIEGGVVVDDALLLDGSLPRRISLEEANERERSALRGLGADWFGRASASSNSGGSSSKAAPAAPPTSAGSSPRTSPRRQHAPLAKSPPARSARLSPAPASTEHAERAERKRLSASSARTVTPSSSVAAPPAAAEPAPQAGAGSPAE